MRKSSSTIGPDQPLAWDDIRFFMAVACEGGLSAAARVLGVEHSTVARRVAQLERQLGLRLFDRLPRAWTLTPEGQSLLAPAQKLEADVQTFSRAAVAANAAMGRVKVSAPPMIAARLLAPGLSRHAQAWSDMALDLVAETRSANLHRREADIAVRLSRPTEEGLTARRIGALEFDLYATPEWLERPASAWQFAGYGDPIEAVPQMQALARFAGDRPFVLRSNDLAVLFETCRAGLAITALPRYLVQEDHRIIPVPGLDRPIRRDLWLVVHPDVRRAPKVRRMADLLAQVVRDGLDAA